MRRDRNPGAAAPPPPRIAGVPEGVDRPFWSVMIPTYQASAHLEETLRAVLSQDPGPDRMQIAVVDDCSDDASQRIVAEVAPGRVEFYRNATNLGLAGNWNACLGLARGRWVHILHQDDLVSPGFYEQLGRGSEARPDIGAAICGFAYIDAQGDRIKLGPTEQETAGVLEGWSERAAVDVRIQCPAIVVKREVYERLGGFRHDLRFVLDWEMWARIASAYPVWYEPKVLASWRDHAGSETQRLQKSRAILPDMERGIDIICGHIPPSRRDAVRREAMRRSRWWTLLEVDRLMKAGEPWEAIGLINRSYRDENPASRVLALMTYSRWGATVWLRRLISRSARVAPGASPGGR